MEATLVDIPRIKFTLALVPSAEIKWRLVVQVIGLSAIIALFS